MMKAITKDAKAVTALDGISKLIKQRKIIYLKSTKSKRVDVISDQVIVKIKKSFSDLPCDFIIETLTHLGHAPQILYDDNGLFAVTPNGYQPVVTGKERIDGAMTAFVEKNMWAKTIRAAILIYLKSCGKNK